MPSEGPSAADGVVEHLFRHSAGRITATLLRALGPERLDLAEEAVADALELALRTWPQTGVPDNPGGWLFRAARNRALDVVRLEQTLRAKLPLLAELGSVEQTAGDDELAAKFLSCARRTLSESAATRALAIIRGIESVTDMREVTKILRGT